MTFAYGFPSDLSGTYIVRCIASGGASVRGFSFEESQEIDLLDKDTDPSIRCYDYDTAHRFCTHPECTMTQAIAAGDFEVIETTLPAKGKLTIESALRWGE